MVTMLQTLCGFARRVENKLPSKDPPGEKNDELRALEELIQSTPAMKPRINSPAPTFTDESWSETRSVPQLDPQLLRHDLESCDDDILAFNLVAEAIGTKSYRRPTAEARRSRLMTLLRTKAKIDERHHHDEISQERPNREGIIRPEKPLAVKSPRKSPSSLRSDVFRREGRRQAKSVKVDAKAQERHMRKFMAAVEHMLVNSSDEETDDFASPKSELSAVSRLSSTTEMTSSTLDSTSIAGPETRPCRTELLVTPAADIVPVVTRSSSHESAMPQDSLPAEPAPLVQADLIVSNNPTSKSKHGRRRMPCFCSCGSVSPTPSLEQEIFSQSNDKAKGKKVTLSLPELIDVERSDETIEILFVEEDFQRSDYFKYGDTEGLIFASAHHATENATSPWWRQDQWTDLRGRSPTEGHRRVSPECLTKGQENTVGRQLDRVPNVLPDLVERGNVDSCVDQVEVECVLVEGAGDIRPESPTKSIDFPTCRRAVKDSHVLQHSMLSDCQSALSALEEMSSAWQQTISDAAEILADPPGEYFALYAMLSSSWAQGTSRSLTASENDQAVSPGSPVGLNESQVVDEKGSDKRKEAVIEIESGDADAGDFPQNNQCAVGVTFADSTGAGDIKTLTKGGVANRKPRPTHAPIDSPTVTRVEEQIVNEWKAELSHHPKSLQESRLNDTRILSAKQTIGFRQQDRAKVDQPHLDSTTTSCKRRGSTSEQDSLVNLISDTSGGSDSSDSHFCIAAGISAPRSDNQTEVLLTSIQEVASPSWLVAQSTGVANHRSSRVYRDMEGASCDDRGCDPKHVSCVKRQTSNAFCKSPTKSETHFPRDSPMYKVPRVLPFSTDPSVAVPLPSLANDSCKTRAGGESVQCNDPMNHNESTLQHGSQSSHEPVLHSSPRLIVQSADVSCHPGSHANIGITSDSHLITRQLPRKRLLVEGIQTDTGRQAPNTGLQHFNVNPFSNPFIPSDNMGSTQPASSPNLRSKQEPGSDEGEPKIFTFNGISTAQRDTGADSKPRHDSGLTPFDEVDATRVSPNKFSAVIENARSRLPLQSGRLTENDLRHQSVYFTREELELSNLSSNKKSQSARPTEDTSSSTNPRVQTSRAQSDRNSSQSDGHTFFVPVVPSTDVEHGQSAHRESAPSSVGAEQPSKVEIGVEWNTRFRARDQSEFAAKVSPNQKGTSPRHRSLSNLSPKEGRATLNRERNQFVGNESRQPMSPTSQIIDKMRSSNNLSSSRRPCVESKDVEFYSPIDFDCLQETQLSRRHHESPETQVASAMRDDSPRLSDRASAPLHVIRSKFGDQAQGMAVPEAMSEQVMHLRRNEVGLDQGTEVVPKNVKNVSYNDKILPLSPSTHTLYEGVHPKSPETDTLFIDETKYNGANRALVDSTFQPFSQSNDESNLDQRDGRRNHQEGCMPPSLRLGDPNNGSQVVIENEISKPRAVVPGKDVIQTQRLSLGVPPHSALSTVNPQNEQGLAEFVEGLCWESTWSRSTPGVSADIRSDSPEETSAIGAHDARIATLVTSNRFHGNQIHNAKQPSEQKASTFAYVEYGVQPLSIVNNRSTRKQMGFDFPSTKATSGPIVYLDQTPSLPSTVVYETQMRLQTTTESLEDDGPGEKVMASGGERRKSDLHGSEGRMVPINVHLGSSSGGIWQSSSPSTDVLLWSQSRQSWVPAGVLADRTEYEEPVEFGIVGQDCEHKNHKQTARSAECNVDDCGSADLDVMEQQEQGRIFTLRGNVKLAKDKLVNCFSALGSNPSSGNEASAAFAGRVFVGPSYNIYGHASRPQTELWLPPAARIEGYAVPSTEETIAFEQSSNEVLGNKQRNTIHEECWLYAEDQGFEWEEEGHPSAPIQILDRGVCTRTETSSLPRLRERDFVNQKDNHPLEHDHIPPPINRHEDTRTRISSVNLVDERLLQPESRMRLTLPVTEIIDLASNEASEELSRPHDVEQRYSGLNVSTPFHTSRVEDAPERYDAAAPEDFLQDAGIGKKLGTLPVASAYSIGDDSEPHISTDHSRQLLLPPMQQGPQVDHAQGMRSNRDITSIPSRTTFSNQNGVSREQELQRHDMRSKPDPEPSPKSHIYVNELAETKNDPHNGRIIEIRLRDMDSTSSSSEQTSDAQHRKSSLRSITSYTQAGQRSLDRIRRYIANMREGQGDDNIALRRARKAAHSVLDRKEFRSASEIPWDLVQRNYMDSVPESTNVSPFLRGVTQRVISPTNSKHPNQNRDRRKPSRNGSEKESSGNRILDSYVSSSESTESAPTQLESIASEEAESILRRRGGRVREYDDHVESSTTSATSEGFTSYSSSGHVKPRRDSVRGSPPVRSRQPEPKRTQANGNLFPYYASSPVFEKPTYVTKVGDRLGHLKPPRDTTRKYSDHEGKGREGPEARSQRAGPVSHRTRSNASDNSADSGVVQRSHVGRR